MKKNLTNPLLFILLFVFTLGLVSCKKDPLIAEEKERYSQIVTPQLEAAMAELGMKINRGTKPPKVEGYYMYEPYCIASSTGEDDLGPNYSDFYFSLLNQRRLSIESKAYEIDSSHIGIGTFITGEGDKFTIYIENETTSSYNNKAYTHITLFVLSGEIVRDKQQNILGIKNFLHALMMKQNGGDPTLIDTNTGRLFEAYGGYVEAISATEFYNYVRRHTGAVKNEAILSERASIFSVVE